MSLRKISKTEPTRKTLIDLASKKRWPTLWEHLTATAYDDIPETARATSTVTLFSRDDGSLGATLNDRDNARACFASAGGLLELLDALERVAGDEQTVWREDRQQTGGSKRKK